MTGVGSGSYQSQVESNAAKIHAEGGTMKLPLAPLNLHHAFSVCPSAIKGDPAAISWSNLVLCAGTDIHEGFAINASLRAYLEEILQLQHDSHEKAGLIALQLQEVQHRDQLGEMSRRNTELQSKVLELTNYIDK